MSDPCPTMSAVHIVTTKQVPVSSVLTCVSAANAPNGHLAHAEAFEVPQERLPRDPHVAAGELVVEVRLRRQLQLLPHDRAVKAVRPLQ